MRLEDGYSLFHGAGGLHHLWQEHLATAEELTDGVHAIHKGTLYDVDSIGIFGKRLGDIFLKIVGNALDESMLQTFGEGEIAPLLMLGGRCLGIVAHGFLFGFYLLGKGDESLGGILAAIEHHILDYLEFVGGDITI